MSLVKSPPYNALTVANYLIRKSGGAYSQLKIQKLMYLAHMIFMGRNNGVPLLKDAFQAWEYGPVIPAVYHALKHNGRHPVPCPIVSYIDAELLPDVQTLLDDVVNNLGALPASTLVAVTHQKGGAWDKAYNGFKEQTISNVEILNEFRVRMNVKAS